MRRTILFSTGNCYKLTKDINRQISIAAKLRGIDGIEILFPTAVSLMQFRLKPKQRKALQKFKIKTIHLPFYTTHKKRYYYFWNTPSCRRLLEKAFDIARQINAVNLNMHAHQLRNPKVLHGFPEISLTFENLAKEFGVADYKKIFSLHPGFGLLLDTSHAMRRANLKAIIKNFRSRIRLVHLSATIGDDDHYHLHRVHRKYSDCLTPVKELKCPYIIEAGREKGLTAEDFQNEIGHVRKWMG